LAIAGISALSLVGCGTPTVTEPQTTDTASASPSPTLPALTPPHLFDTAHTVRLKPVDEVATGTLSGDSFFTVSNDTAWSIDVHDGSVLFGTPLGNGEPAICWEQVVDANRVYTATLTPDSDPAAPATLDVTALDRTSGAVEWTYQPPADVVPAGADCESATSTLDATTHGLLLSLSRVDRSTLGNPVSALSWMLDPATGHPLWQTATDVLATDGTDFGVSVAPAQTPTPMGVFFYQASPINLATGEIGQAFWQTGNSVQVASRYQLAGRVDNNLILLAHSTDTMASTTTVYEVSTTTGQATAQPIVKLQATNLGLCEVAAADRLVCTATNDSTGAYGISLTDGSTVWQHPYRLAGATTAPVLFGGNLYGFDPDKHVSYVLNTTDGTVLQTGAYPPAVSVNETGLVFTVPTADGTSAWQCWWAPALA